MTENVGGLLRSSGRARTKRTRCQRNISKRSSKLVGKGNASSLKTSPLSFSIIPAFTFSPIPHGARPIVAPLFFPVAQPQPPPESRARPLPELRHRYPDQWVLELFSASLHPCRRPADDSRQCLFAACYQSDQCNRHRLKQVRACIL